jgi:hypothetical protein
MWSAAMDVGEWLKGIGLDQYEASFRDNKIDAAVLPQLTADDLKDIGVVAGGDRRKLLAAISGIGKRNASFRFFRLRAEIHAGAFATDRNVGVGLIRRPQWASRWLDRRGVIILRLIDLG